MATARQPGRKSKPRTGVRRRGVVQSSVVDEGVGFVEVHGFLAPREVVAIRNAIHDFEGRSLFRVVLDLEDVNGMTMLGLAHLVDQLWELREQGGDLRLLGLSDALYHILSEIGAENLFQCYVSREEARRWSTHP